MPIPITANTTRPEIISPNMNGNVIIKRNQFIKLSCPGTFFVSPFLNRKINEITVKCKTKHYLEYFGKVYPFDKFFCNDTPHPNLKLTGLTCQNNSNNKVFEIGFRTRNRNIPFIRICFDLEYKNPLYVWYHLQSPYIKRRQISRTRPCFIRTRFYSPLNLNAVYSYQVSKPYNNFLLLPRTVIGTQNINIGLHYFFVSLKLFET